MTDHIYTFAVFLCNIDPPVRLPSRQCRTWRGVGGTAGGALRLRSPAGTRLCAATGSPASGSNSLPSVRTCRRRTPRLDRGAAPRVTPLFALSILLLQPADRDTCWSTSTRMAASGRESASTRRRWRGCSPRRG